MIGQIVTGNRLDDGVVIFLAEDGSWTPEIERARVADREQEAKVLEDMAASAEKARLVVGPYLIEVERRDGALVPVRYRERIRAYGPSIHPQFGRRDVPGHFLEGGDAPGSYMPTGRVGRKAAAMDI